MTSGAANAQSGPRQRNDPHHGHLLKNARTDSSQTRTERSRKRKGNEQIAPGRSELAVAGDKRSCTQPPSEEARIRLPRSRPVRELLLRASDSYWRRLENRSMMSNFLRPVAGQGRRCRGNEGRRRRIIEKHGCLLQRVPVVRRDANGRRIARKRNFSMRHCK